jgi:hypothetical protein
VLLQKVLRDDDSSKDTLSGPKSICEGPADKNLISYLVIAKQGHLPELTPARLRYVATHIRATSHGDPKGEPSTAEAKIWLFRTKEAHFGVPLEQVEVRIPTRCIWSLRYS